MVSTRGQGVLRALQRGDEHSRDCHRAAALCALPLPDRRCRRCAMHREQVSAIHIEETVRPVLKEPGGAFPSRRGRPTRAAVTPYSPGGSLPLLDPTAERKFLREAVHEVIWNAVTLGRRLTFKPNAFIEGSPQRMRMVTSVCKLDPAYQS